MFWPAFAADHVFDEIADTEPVVSHLFLEYLHPLVESPVESLVGLRHLLVEFEGGFLK